MIHLQLTASTSYGTRRHEDDLVTLLPQPRHLIHECRNARYVQFAVLAGKDVGADFDDKTKTPSPLPLKGESGMYLTIGTLCPNKTVLSR